MIALYLLGILMGILMAMLLKTTLFKGEAVPFVMELPNYRMPGAKSVLQLMWDKAKDFLQRAFSVIFIGTIVVWFLQNFNFSMNKNKVVALAEDKGISRIRQIERWASLELRTEDTKGDGSYGSLYGDYLVYKDGQLQLKNGLPVEENGDWGYLGNVNPDWTGGLGTDFKYKNWTFSALFGFQHGGSVYSRTYI